MAHGGRTCRGAYDPGELRRSQEGCTFCLAARASRRAASDVVTPRETCLLRSLTFGRRGRFAPRSSARQRAIPDARGLSVGRSRIAPGSWRRGPSSRTQRLVIVSRMRDAVSLGVLPTLTPAASNASFLAAAVPDDPDTIAPACPMVLPSGAVKPAT
jgi:hypothetical protein